MIDDIWQWYAEVTGSSGSGFEDWGGVTAEVATRGVQVLEW